MITEKQSADIRTRALGFEHQSFRYIDYSHCKNCAVLENGDDMILLLDGTVSPKLLFWAVRDADVLVAALGRIEGDLQVNFVPPSFVAALESAGFEMLAEFVDYFNDNLSSYAGGAEKEAEYMVPADAEEVSKISVSCCGQSRGFRGEAAAWFLDWLGDGNDVVIVRDYNRIAGFCCVSIFGDPRTLWIREIAVSPDFQNRGYGKTLMEAAVRYGSEHGANIGFLAVDIQNRNAIGLYERFGFSKKGDDSEIQMVRLGS